MSDTVTLITRPSGARAKRIHVPAPEHAGQASEAIAQQIVQDLADRYRFGLNHFHIKQGENGAAEIIVSGNAVTMANTIIEETVRKYCPVPEEE